MKQVSLRGGLRMMVEDQGQGEPLLMLHAGVADRHMWDRQWDWLSQTMRVIRWDWRGYGETPQVSGPFSYSEDVISVMDNLQLGRAALMACSFSGAVAIKVAVEHPERISRLVLSGSGIPGYEFSNPPQVEQLFAQVDAAFNNGDIEQELDLLEKLWLVGPDRQADDVDGAYLQEARILLRRTMGADNVEAEDFNWSAKGRLGEINVPVLVVVGDADVPDTVKSCSFLAQALPNARLEIIKGAAHLPSMEKPDAFNAILRDWLAL